MSQGIQIGDAVLNFLADKTQLDAAFASVEAGAENAIKPAAVDVEVLENRIKELELELKRMAEEFESAGHRAAGGLREAKGELALIGEATGVHIPRHIRGFVSQLPGVGEALEAAFSATAVLFLIQILVEGVKKLSEWVSETLIFTKEQKKAEEQIKATAEAVAKYAAEFKKAHQVVLDFNKTQTELAEDKIQKATLAVQRQEQAVRDLEDAYGHYAVMTGRVTEEEAKQGQLRITMNKALLATLQAQLDAAIVEAQKTEKDDYDKRRIATIDAEENMGKAKIAIQREFGLLYLAGQKDNAEYIDQVERKAAASLLAIQVSALQRKLKIAEEDPTHNVEKIIQIKAQIDTIEKEYTAKSLARMTETINKYQKLEEELQKHIVVSREIRELTMDDADAQVTFADKLQNTKDALKTLGIEGFQDLKGKLRDQTQALYTLQDAQKAGMATTHDVILANLKLIDTKIKLAQAEGKSTLALKQEEAQMKKMLPEVKQYGTAIQSALLAGERAMMQTAFAFGQGSITISQALRQIAAAVVESIASIAEKKGVEQMAEGFGSWPDAAAMAQHFAAAGLWFGLAGGISAAAGAVAGGSATPGTAANPVNTTQSNSPATQPQAGPVGITTVQRFANGGLITQPTLGILAERPGSKGEVAFDLDDERAKSNIRDAMGGGGTVVHVHVHGGMITGDNLKKVVNEINKGVKNNTLHLKSSDSFRVTRRSQ